MIILRPVFYEKHQMNYIWVVVAAQNQRSAQVFQALEWEYNVMSSLDREIDGPSSR